MFSDLECDYINPIDLCNKLNQVCHYMKTLWDKFTQITRKYSLFYQKWAPMPFYSSCFLWMVVGCLYFWICLWLLIMFTSKCFSFLVGKWIIETYSIGSWMGVICMMLPRFSVPCLNTKRNALSSLVSTWL